MLADQILELPRNERLLCMEALWDSLRSDEMDSPKWHEEVLGSRVAEIEAGQGEFISSSEMKKRLSRD
jgi:putative addiction module component (TIGR02574 family)